MSKEKVDYGEMDKICSKCQSEFIWIECGNCEEGFTDHDCGEDTCACLEPFLNVECDHCNGKGGWWDCFCKAYSSVRGKEQKE